MSDNKASKPRDKVWPARIVKHMSVTAPAVRMVVIHAFAWEDEPGALTVDHVVYPVIGIRSTVAARYVKRVPLDSYPEGGPDHAAMIREGWQFAKNEVSHETLIYTDDFGITDSDFAVANNAAEKVVVCPWPFAEDEGRLRPIIEALRSEAIEKAESHRAGRHEAAV